MRKRASGFKDLVATLWNTVAGWLSFSLLLIVLIGGIGVNRFMELQRAMATLGTESSELLLLKGIREDLLALENASRYTGKENPVVFLEAMATSSAHLKSQLDSLNTLIADSILRRRTDSLGQLLTARTLQLSALVRLKYEQNEAVMPNSLLLDVEEVLAGKLDSTIVIRLDKYIQKREVPITGSEETGDAFAAEQGRKNLMQQLRDFFGGKKKESTPKSREEISLTDSILQIEPLQADRREEVRLLLESARNYNSRLAASVQKKEMALRESGRQLQLQLSRLTEQLESGFMLAQQKRSREAMNIARQAANMLAIISACGLLMGLILMLVLRKMLRISALRQKQLEEEQKKVADLLVSRQKLLGNISHELRTPLQAITGFANQLAEASADKQKRWIGLIKQSARQLNFLMGQLLQLNQLENARSTPDFTTFSLSSLADELNEIYGQKLREKQLSWELISDFGEDLGVKSDPNRLRQILYNLLDNAVKYTSSGGVSLEVICLDKELRFILTDTGIGMTRDEIPVIFEAYTQKENKADVLQSGVGLGLHLVRQLVEKLSAKLEVESEVGVGSTFTLTLPVTYEKLAELASTEPQKGQVLPLRIMVVDDDELNLELLKNVLETRVARLRCFSSAETAIASFEAGAFDVVLTDYRLPGQSGASLAETLSNKDEQLTFYLMTAAISESEAKTVLSKNFSYLLNKPFEPEELFKLLEEEVLRLPSGQSVNVSRIDQFMAADAETKASFLTNYKISLEHQLTALEAARVSRDFKGLHEILHQLGSRVALLQLPNVITLRALEKKAVENEWHWEEDFQLKRQLRILRAFLANWI